MTAFIIPDDDSGRIITFDVIESEMHETVSEVTEHPVEVGVNPTDHVRVLPDRLSLIAYTTNTPIAVNPFTQRGEIQSLPFEVPTWTPPLEPTPGSLFRNAIGGIGSLLFGSPEMNVVLLTFPEPFNAIVETYEQLLELQQNAVLLQIATPIRLYEDMILERVSAPRIAGDSGVSFGLDVRKIRIVESGQVAAPPTSDIPGGVPLSNKGSQGAKPPTGEDEGKGGSVAYNFLSGVGLL